MSLFTKGSTAFWFAAYESLSILRILQSVSLLRNLISADPINPQPPVIRILIIYNLI